MAEAVSKKEEVVKEKNTTSEKTDKEKKSIKQRFLDLFYKTDEFSKWDYVLFALIAVFCFFSFAHSDIVFTGNRSWKMYDGILSFYDNVSEWTGDYGANYFPSTFIVYAIWILPLKLFGVQAPDLLLRFNYGLILWYKLLPVLVYVASVILIYKIGRQAGLSVKRAKLAMYAFMTTPVCFYSQFVFSQCDIFTVFFLLLGMYYFYRDEKYDMLRFAIFVGISCTFKYFSLLILFSFILLRKKDVISIAKYSIVGMLPLGIEYLMYHKSEVFSKCVFGFSALNYANDENIKSGSAVISYMKVACIIVVLLAYFVKTESKKDEFAWSMYISCGLMFALFGLSRWHPQWLIFAAPFWMISAVINKNFEKFMWLDLGLLVFMYFYCVYAFLGQVGEALTVHMIWRHVFNVVDMWYRTAYVIPSIGLNTSFSFICAIMLAMFIFKHPKYALDDFADDTVDNGRSHMHLMRLRLLATFAAVTLPTFFALYVNTKQSNSVITFGASYKSIEMTEQTVVTQDMPTLKGTITSLSFSVGFTKEDTNAILHMTITDETGSVVASHDFDYDELEAVAWKDNGVLKGGQYKYWFDTPFLADENKEYSVNFTATGNENAYDYTLAVGTNAYAPRCAKINGEVTDDALCLSYINVYATFKDAYKAYRAKFFK